MNGWTTLRASTLVLSESNIDTDQIIPARFLTTTGRDGLGEMAFADWRFDADGKARPDCVLNEPDARDTGILVAGENFGCGSSREHAPWALLDFGFRAVISSHFADIFRANALKNGLLVVEVEEAVHHWLLTHPGVELAIDLDDLSLTLPDERKVHFPLEAFARHCLMQGVDQLGFLVEQGPAIHAFEKRTET